jgi:hypothetical protein
MAYTGGNSGYVRRLGKIPSTTPVAPTTPVTGYAAWFDGSTSVYSDVLATTPATNGSNVRAWKSRDGSYGALTLKKDSSPAILAPCQPSSSPAAKPPMRFWQH